MKPSILALCILHCALCILPAHAERMPEQIAGDLFPPYQRQCPLFVN